MAEVESLKFPDYVQLPGVEQILCHMAVEFEAIWIDERYSKGSNRGEAVLPRTLKVTRPNYPGGYHQTGQQIPRRVDQGKQHHKKERAVQVGPNQGKGRQCPQPASGTGSDAIQEKKQDAEQEPRQQVWAREPVYTGCVDSESRDKERKQRKCASPSSQAKDDDRGQSQDAAVGQCEASQS